jgi:hypothetical protein
MDEGMRLDSGGSYGAQMAGGAADMAAKVAVVPMPSVESAEVVEPSGGSSSGGSGGSGGSGSSSSSSAPSESGTPPAASGSADDGKKTDKKTETKPRTPAAPVLFAYVEDKDLLQDIASEKRNGKEERYLRAAPPQLKSVGGPADPDLDSLLKPRTVHPSPAPSLGDIMPHGVPKRAAVQEHPDPERLEEVRGARREEIKTETHLFLHRLESRYGKMSDIQRVSCDSDRDTCREHGLRRAYLSMVTSTGAKLSLGFKRGDRGSRMNLEDGRGGFSPADTREPARWRLYTVDFKDRDGLRPGEAAGAAGEAEEEEEEEE